MTPRRWWMLAAAAFVLSVVVGLTLGYVTPSGSQWPATEGEPYEIALDPDGCPIIVGPFHFVDSPGDLVPANPVEVVLCTTPTEASPPFADLGHRDEKARVLRTGAPEFAAVLNRLPDRNAWWREWQHKHGGFFPDPPPDLTMCQGSSVPFYEQSFVLRYSDRPPVALISRCETVGWTTGSRTRMDTWTRPHIVDQFLQRYEAQ